MVPSCCFSLPASHFPELDLRYHGSSPSPPSASGFPTCSVSNVSNVSPSPCSCGSHCKAPQSKSRSMEFSPGVRKVASWFPPVASLCQRLTTRNWTSSGTTPLPPPPSASGFPTFRRQCRWSGRPALPPTWRRPPPDSDPPSGSPS